MPDEVFCIRFRLIEAPSDPLGSDPKGDVINYSASEGADPPGMSYEIGAGIFSAEPCGD